MVKYEKPSVTADIIIFTIQNQKLKVLLIKRGVEPFKNMFAIPGGFVKMNENLEQAAKRELEEETGVKEVYLEQLYTFGEVNRDPRGRVITVAYFALINPEKAKQELEATTDASAAEWFDVSGLPQLAFDHKKILDYAIKRVKWKFEYTTIAFSMLPKHFTLTQLQKVYETVFEKKFDKRNFRKKILSLNILESTEEKEKDVSYRPPELYSLKKSITIGKIIEMI
ncbi:MAG: NUDIX domain-containing protein [Nanoarchaeota archaeon]|nr:NUDIX domain-containing protein [Nanoarchaeota archaeon]